MVTNPMTPHQKILGKTRFIIPPLKTFYFPQYRKFLSPLGLRMEEEEIVYERKIFKFLGREKAMQWERNELEADLLVSELVAQTNVCTMLRNETTKKKSNKK